MSDRESDLDLYDGTGGGFGVAASAVLAIAQRNNPGSACSDPVKRREQLFQRMHQVPIGLISITLTAGAGAFQMNDLLAPKAGYMWSVRRLTANGFTAGSVSVFKNGFVAGGVATGGEQLPGFASAGTNTFGRGEVLLDQNDYLIFSATGITGTVQIQGAADCFERWLLPEYLM